MCIFILPLLVSNVILLSHTPSNTKYSSAPYKIINEIYTEDALKGKKIVLDAGHGGKGVGAVSKTNLKEKDLNIILTTKVAALLESMGAEIIFTRNPGIDVNLPLEDRINIANNSCADLFISVHHDFNTDTTANGVSIYYSSYRPSIDREGISVIYNYRVCDYIMETNKNVFFHYNGKVVCQPFSKANLNCVDKTPCIQAQNSIRLAKILANAVSSTEFHNRGCKDWSYRVTRYTTMPSVLIECGFLSNKDDLIKVTNPSMQDGIAKAIAEGINYYFNGNL